MLTRSQRMSTATGRAERAAASRALVAEAVEAASSRNWIDCGGLATAALRRSTYFKALPDEQRFALTWEIAEGGCWQWVGSRKTVGYGQIRFRGSNWNAHRVAYTLHVGPIPADMALDHLCLNKCCVNPAHLEPVTNAENTRRYGETVTECPKGHAYTPENTIKKGGRKNCRTCHNKRTAAIGKTRGRPVRPDIKATLAERSGGYCEMGLTGCTGQATDPAHRIGRKAGGRPNDDLDHLANLIHACRSCHRWTHERPAEAQGLGLMLREGQDPRIEPFAFRNADWRLIDDFGGYAGEWTDAP
jgi:hypothetical protein